jgi:hypothetical protein
VAVLLALAVSDAAFRKIVRRKLHCHAVTWDYSDEMLPHLPGNMSYNLMSVFKLYSKLSPWKGLDDHAC